MSDRRNRERNRELRNQRERKRKREPYRALAEKTGKLEGYVELG